MGSSKVTARWALGYETIGDLLAASPAALAAAGLGAPALREIGKAAQELVFVCPEGCAGSGTYVAAVD